MDRGPLKVLTDTHTLVWALSEPEILGTAAKTALAELPVAASVVNLWELVLKAGKPGALVRDPIPWWKAFVIGSRITTLPVRTRHIAALAALPEIHKDPFDRLLVAQAMAEGLTLISKDALLPRYGVPVVWD